MIVKRSARGVTAGNIIVTDNDLEVIRRMVKDGESNIAIRRALPGLPNRNLNAVIGWMDREAAKQSKADAHLDWSLSRAYRSNMPVKRCDVTREWEPKILPQGGNGDAVAHCDPTGLPDPEFLRMRRGVLVAA